MSLDLEPIAYLNKRKTVRLSHDGLQWILEKGDRRKRVAKSDSGFRGQSYVMSSKEALLRCIREKEFEVDLDGRQRLAALHSTYRSFLSDVERSGARRVSLRLYRMAKNTTPLPERLVTGRWKRLRRIETWRAKRGASRQLKAAA